MVLSCTKVYTLLIIESVDMESLFNAEIATDASVDSDGFSSNVKYTLIG